MAKEFLTLTGPDATHATPMDSVLRLRAYGRAIRDNATEEGKIDWDGEKVLYGQISFDMSALRSMVHGMVEEAKAVLFRDLMLLKADEEGALTDEGMAELPQIDWANMADNPAETASGWNLFKDSRNKERLKVNGVEGRDWLRLRILGNAEKRSEFVDVDRARDKADAVPWSAKRILKYGRCLAEFKERLLVVVHMTGGQPGRATELYSQHFKNSANGTQRSVYVERGLIAMVSTYHKGYAQTAKPKIIHRYLPREVGELMFYYLWLILPFWEHLEAVCAGRRGETSGFIWEPVREAARETRRQRKKREREAEDK
jgi:hypothetical protein